MQVMDDRLRPAGGDTAERLAGKMSGAGRVVANGNVVTNGGGNGNGNGNGLTRDRARRIAGDIGAAILADVNEGTAEHSADVVLITEAIGERMKVRGES